MKNLFCCLLALGLISGSTAIAQTAKKEIRKEEKKKIIIKSDDGDQDERLEIEINNGNVTINGKPAKDYKGQKHIVIDDNEISINGDEVHIPRRGKMKIHCVGEGCERAFLGVVTKKADKGVTITEVMDESAAEKAGLKEGDIITNVNDKKITDEESLVQAVRSYKPDDSVDITYLHEGTEKKVKAVLGKNEEPFAMSWNMNEDFDHQFDGDMEPPVAMVGSRGSRAFAWSDDADMWAFRSDRPKYGMSIEDNADGDGAKVTDIEAGSNAEKAGLKKDDIITEVDGKPVKGLDELKGALKNSKDKTAFSFKILRNGKPETLTIKVPKIIKKAEF